MNRSVSICAVVWLILVPAAHSMEFGADGRRLDPLEDRQRQYQWKDPATGKAITKPYPPANLQMRQIGKSDDGMTVYLEVIQPPEGHSNFQSTIKAGELSSEPNGGLRDSEVWLATEKERKAAEEAERRHQEEIAEAQAKAEAAERAAARAQQDFDNQMKIEMLKAMLEPQVIIIKRGR